MKEPRSALLIADSGDGKTTTLANFAKWLWDKKKKRTRLIVADSGGTSQFDDMNLIEDGIVERFPLYSTPYVLAYFNKLSKGYWPLKDDSGEWVVSAKNGCPIIKESEDYRNYPDDLGCYMFESVSGVANLMGSHVSQPKNAVFKNSKEILEDDYSFGTISEANIGVVHKELRNGFNSGFKFFGSEVEYFLATALIDKKEDRQKVSAYFPATIGKAIAKEIGSWFQDTFHLATQEVLGQEFLDQRIWPSGTTKDLDRTISAKVAWFMEHKDEQTGIPYKCKYRITSQLMDKVSERYPNGYFILDHKYGLVRFYNFLDIIRQEFNKKEEAHAAKVE